MDESRVYPSAEEQLPRLRFRYRELRTKCAQQVTELQQHIKLHLGCSDCGAPAGQPCKPDYGCQITDRTVR
jgi:hypothetical protein